MQKNIYYFILNKPWKKNNYNIWDIVFQMLSRCKNMFPTWKSQTQTPLLWINICCHLVEFLHICIVLSVLEKYHQPEREGRQRVLHPLKHKRYIQSFSQISESFGALIVFSLCPHSCSLQPEPEWHRPPDVSRGHDVTAGGRRGVGGRRPGAAGRRQSWLPWRQPPAVPETLAAASLRLRVWTDTGESVCLWGCWPWGFKTTLSIL